MSMLPLMTPSTASSGGYSPDGPLVSNAFVAHSDSLRRAFYWMLGSGLFLFVCILSSLGVMRSDVPDAPYIVSGICAAGGLALVGACVNYFRRLRESPPRYEETQAQRNLKIRRDTEVLARLAFNQAHTAPSAEGREIPGNAVVRIFEYADVPPRITRKGRPQTKRSANVSTARPQLIIENDGGYVPPPVMIRVHSPNRKNKRTRRM